MSFEESKDLDRMINDEISSIDRLITQTNQDKDRGGDDYFSARRSNYAYLWFLA